MKKECLLRLINAMKRLPVAVQARALTALLAALSCVSCSKEALVSFGEEDGMQPLNVIFRMAIPMDASTVDSQEYNDDQTWGDDYNQENALSAENRILWDDFSVAFFSENDNSYIGHLRDIHCINLLPGVDMATYECKGVLTTTEDMKAEELVEKLRSSGKVRTLVIANVKTEQKTLEAGISGADAGLGAMEYSCNGLFNIDFPAIPMWGMTTNDFSGLTLGKSIDLGKVALLRSVAKVEVLVSDELQQASENTIKLTSVSVSRMNTTGYVLPGNWNNIDKTENLKFSETLRIPEPATKEEDKTFSVRDDGRVLFYLPECRNGSGDDEIVLTVNYTVEDEAREGIIHLCDYSNGNPDRENLWDVVRNHLYRYIITNSGEIKFMVEVHPWDEVEIPEIMM